MRSQKHVLLPQEDAAAFAALETAILAELAPEGALQTVLARRVAIAAWRLERADRLEAEVLEVRSHDGANPGVALIRDGNGTRAFETLMRYRGAAMAEFTRALRTLKALQAEDAAATTSPLATHPARLAPRPAVAKCRQPNEPERGNAHRLEYTPPDPPGPGRTLQEAAAPWMPNEPEPRPGSRPQRRLECVLPATLAPGHTLNEPAVPWTPSAAGPERDGEPEAHGATAPSLA